MKLAVALFAFSVFAQTRPAFEVASIKPSPPITSAAQKMGIGLRMDDSQVSISSYDLRDLIRAAYGLQDFQIQGPDSLDGQRWDVQAKIPAGESRDRVNEMLLTLLIERFGLKAHTENKDHSVYALIQAKGGAKLLPPDAAAGKTGITVDNEGIAHLAATRATAQQFVDTISRFADKPILDMTGLTGEYRFEIQLPLSEIKRGARPALESGEASDPASGMLFRSVEKLGLRLDSRKTGITHLVVDSVAKTPSEN